MLNGSDLLASKITGQYHGIMLETFLCNELIHLLNSREDLFYWKSHNKAEVDFLIRSPGLISFDIKAGQKHNISSLNSMALLEKELDLIVLVANISFSYNPNHVARIPNYPDERKVKLLKIPYYLVPRIKDFTTYF